MRRIINYLLSLVHNPVYISVNCVRK